MFRFFFVLYQALDIVGLAPLWGPKPAMEIPQKVRSYDRIS
jgi:hypothetical protein